MFPQQKTFGNFVAELFGPKWVYATRSTDRIRRQYPNSIVITPKQQRELARGYRAEWGREHDANAWAMLCALREAHKRLKYHHPQSVEDKLALVMIETAIQAETGVAP